MNRSSPMHIAVVGHIAGEDVRDYLHPHSRPVPVGYSGAPLVGILIGELLRRGHRVTGITTDSALRIEEEPVRFNGERFQFVVCPARRRAWRPNGRLPGRAVDFFRFERNLLADAIRAAAPDVVHAHWTYEFALAAIAQQAPHLITCHDSPAAVLRFTRSPYRAVRYLMARRAFAKGKAFTAVSEYLAQALAPAIGYMPAVVPNPLSPSLRLLSKPRRSAEGRRVAMICNGWDRLKNPEPALHAFANWRGTEPNGELHVFGDGFGPGQHAHAWTSERGIQDGIHFHGRVAHSALMEQLAGMDLLLHPSLEESFGVVVAEAMALGVPVVAGERSGAVPFVLGATDSRPAEAGILVDVRSVSAISEALARVFDDAYCWRSRAGIDRAEACFSPTVVGGQYEEIYRSLAKNADPAFPVSGVAGKSAA